MMFVHDVTRVRLAKKSHGSLGNYPKRKQKGKKKQKTKKKHETTN
jgi:hypothetical protein